VTESALDARRRLAAAVGAVAVADAAVVHRVDDVEPCVVAAPDDAGGLASVLREAAALGAAVIPWGGGTAIAVGNPPRAVDLVLRTARLRRIVDYDAANLTVTVEAGATLAAIDAVLAPRRQFLPLDPPRAPEATIGGTVSVDLSGPRRMRYGGARDAVIGVRVAKADGTLIRWGGKTVKNVAGYDMCKLFVGALGTLGVVTEVTVRVQPCPEVSRTFAVWGGALADLSALARRVIESPLLPSALAIVNREQAAALGRAAAGVLVAVDGVEAAAARHGRDLSAWAARPGIEIETLEAEAAEPLWHSVRDLGWTDDQAAVRISVPSAQLAELVARSAALLPDRGVRWAAHAATGTVWYAYAAPEAAALRPGVWRELADPLGGHLLLARCPRATKSAGDVWSPPPHPRALDLMRAMKRSFDPRGILNPGRFIAGI
jgi:glycolate oxidase FAD binding subunit